MALSSTSGQADADGMPAASAARVPAAAGQPRWCHHGWPGRFRGHVRQGRSRPGARRDAGRCMHRGVYAAFTGKPGRRAELWGVLLRAGPDAVLSHQTAAEVWGLLNGVEPVIHVTVPHGSDPDRYGKIPGVVIHRSRSLERSRHPVLTPPRTRVEETVLDLIDCARSFDEAYDWICRAIGRRRTTAARIQAALEARPRIRWRQDDRTGPRLRQRWRALCPRTPVRAGRGTRPWAANGDPAGSGPAGDRQSVPGQPVCGVPRLRGDRRDCRAPGRRAMAG